MDKIIAHVYVTTDYTKFRKLEVNRGLIKKRLERLIKSFSIGEILNPIVVNKRFEIIDGQGRFEAKKFLRRPIYYIIDADAGIEECRRMNEYNTPWSARDYIESYAAEGNVNYINLLNTLNETKFPVSRVLRMISKSGAEARNEKISEGRLLFSLDDAGKAIQISKLCDDVLTALDFEKRPSEAFYTAMAVITKNPKYNHDRFVNNCKSNRNRYCQMTGLEDQLKEFSRIYNYRVKDSSSKIYFEDYMRNRGYNSGRAYDDSWFGDRTDVSTLE